MVCLGVLLQTAAEALLGTGVHSDLSVVSRDSGYHREHMDETLILCSVDSSSMATLVSGIRSHPCDRAKWTGSTSSGGGETS